MKVKMKVLDRDLLLKLNDSSRRDRRRQQLSPDAIASRDEYIVNFHFGHKANGVDDVRMSVILRPGVLTAWLDVSIEEFDAIPEVEMTELEWEAAVCVGVPRWVE